MIIKKYKTNWKTCRWQQQLRKKPQEMTYPLIVISPAISIELKSIFNRHPCVDEVGTNHQARSALASLLQCQQPPGRIWREWTDEAQSKKTGGEIPMVSMVGKSKQCVCQVRVNMRSRERGPTLQWMTATFLGSAESQW